VGRSRAVLPLLVLLAAAILGGCVAPAVNDGAFRANAKAALGSALSEARTAVLGLDARLADKVTQAFADTVVSGAESALGPIQDSFGSPDPSSRAVDPLRKKVLDLLSSTADELALARIAVRRDDPAGMRQARNELDRLANALQRAEDAVP
jgi:hypothetical protein